MHVYIYWYRFHKLSTSANWFLQFPLLFPFFVALGNIARPKVIPVIKAHAALSAFAHLHDIFLDMLKRGECTYKYCQHVYELKGFRASDLPVYTTSLSKPRKTLTFAFRMIVPFRTLQPAILTFFRFWLISKI